MDVISNMLITIKNGGSVGKKVVETPFSKYKQEIAKAMHEAGYIGGYKKVSKKSKGEVLEIMVKYNEEGKPRITNIKRISKPSRRLYGGVKDIKPVKQGFGKVFLSTPKGVMTGEVAKKEMVGGELLFEIW